MEVARSTFREKESSIDNSSLLYAAKPDECSSVVDIGELNMNALLSPAKKHPEVEEIERLTALNDQYSQRITLKDLNVIGGGGGCNTFISGMGNPMSTIVPWQQDDYGQEAAA